MYQPITARTQSFTRPAGPSAHDCVRVAFVRSGSAELFGETARQSLAFGDAVLLGPSVLCGMEPDGVFTLTTVFLDTDYAIDQVFWQHSDLLRDRYDAASLAETLYTEPFQILRLGEDRAGLLMPWLDELVALSVAGQFRERFNRLQSLWFATADVLAPVIAVTPTRRTRTQCARTWPSSPRHRRFQELREEARLAAQLLREHLGHRWTLGELAERVHLSPSQLGRVFAEAFGKSPIAYLTMLRAERMAQLLRSTDDPISRIAAQVGWPDPDFATRQFRRSVGVNPTQFRAMDHRSRQQVTQTISASHPD